MAESRLSREKTLDLCALNLHMGVAADTKLDPLFSY